MLLIAVGSVEPLKAAIQGDGRQTGSIVLAQPEIKAALAELPPGAPMVAVSDLRVAVPGFFQLFRRPALPVSLVD